MGNSRTTTHPTEPVETGATTTEARQDGTPEAAESLETAVGALEPREKEHYDVMLAGFRKERQSTWPYHRKMIEEMLAAIKEGESAEHQWWKHHRMGDFLHPVATLSQPSIGVLVGLAGLEGLSCGLDFGHKLLYNELADDDTVKAGFLELADDPDIAVMAKAYRMAGDIPD